MHTNEQKPTIFGQVRTNAEIAESQNRRAQELVEKSGQGLKQSRRSVSRAAATAPSVGHPRTGAVEDRSCRGPEQRGLEQSRNRTVIRRGGRSVEMTRAGESSGVEADHKSGKGLKQPNNGAVLEGALSP